MWDDLTPRAKQVLAFAFKEARLLQHQQVDADHLLFGFIRHGGGVAINVLRGAGLDLEVIDTELKQVLGLGTTVRGTEEGIPATRRLKRAIERARSVARELNHQYIGTDHLFLGLLGEEGAQAVLILKKHGVDMAWARQEILKELEQEEPVSSKDSVWKRKRGCVFCWCWWL